MLLIILNFLFYCKDIKHFPSCHPLRLLHGMYKGNLKNFYHPFHNARTVGTFSLFFQLVDTWMRIVKSYCFPWGLAAIDNFYIILKNTDFFSCYFHENTISRKLVFCICFLMFVGGILRGRNLYIYLKTLKNSIKQERNFGIGSCGQGTLINWFFLCFVFFLGLLGYWNICQNNHPKITTEISRTKLKNEHPLIYVRSTEFAALLGNWDQCLFFRLWIIFSSFWSCRNIFQA